MDPNDLIYDWNRLPGSFAYAGARVELNDETLRDGLQNPTVKDPPIERKIEKASTSPVANGSRVLINN